MSSPHPSEYLPPPPPRRPHGRLRRYLPLLVWMGAIFAGSTELLSRDNTHNIIDPVVHWLFPWANYDQRLWLHVFVRKCGHVTEYTILTLLAAYFCLGSSRDLLRRYWWIWTLAFVALFAASDEFHQWFVPGRDASLRDVAIDTSAGIVAIAILALILRWRAARRRRLAAQGI
jgi:VanZ family protein